MTNLTTSTTATVLPTQFILTHLPAAVGVAGRVVRVQGNVLLLEFDRDYELLSADMQRPRRTYAPRNTQRGCFLTAFERRRNVKWRIALDKCDVRLQEGTPDQSTPVAGTPDQGTPVVGTPVRRSAIAVAEGTPDQGTPVAGTPDQGAPVVGTPVRQYEDQNAALENRRTDAPSASAPSTDALATDAPAHQLPSTDAPTTGAPAHLQPAHLYRPSLLLYAGLADNWRSVRVLPVQMIANALKIDRKYINIWLKRAGRCVCYVGVKRSVDVDNFAKWLDQEKPRILMMNAE